MAQHRLHKFRSGITSRPYFFLSFFLTAILYILLRGYTEWDWSTGLLLSWNISIVCYLFLSLKTLWRTNHLDILKRAQQQDASKWVILCLVFLTLVMCVIAIVIELSHISYAPLIKTVHLVLAIMTIISAWFFMHTIFAIHYAHDYYLARSRQQECGLDFPKTTEPQYSDFIYFSYVIGTSAQTADVSITSRSMRVLNTLHILLAYGFNTTILAICINVAASFI